MAKAVRYSLSTNGGYAGQLHGEALAHGFGECGMDTVRNFRGVSFGEFGERPFDAHVLMRPIAPLTEDGSCFPHVRHDAPGLVKIVTVVIFESVHATVEVATEHGYALFDDIAEHFPHNLGVPECVVARPFHRKVLVMPCDAFH